MVKFGSFSEHKPSSMSNLNMPLMVLIKDIFLISLQAQKVGPDDTHRVAWHHIGLMTTAL